MYECVCAKVRSAGNQPFHAREEETGLAAVVNTSTKFMLCTLKKFKIFLGAQDERLC